eukprot:CAMPEP_0119465230 /NCGR_PEP_ID=MMETSP1344-20130328/456_1 /TAXON_ID=236787 /ORGANISM="Florenciella parvula, Strain CCMP2471" /LENGTH=222 /DNA_ID=CAMNT_0007497475 /DNA_START=80 /DNA_END=748 /DNA_ORIENTATION=-
MERMRQMPQRVEMYVPFGAPVVAGNRRAHHTGVRERVSDEVEGAAGPNPSGRIARPHNNLGVVQASRVHKISDHRVHLGAEGGSDVVTAERTQRAADVSRRNAYRCTHHMPAAELSPAPLIFGWSFDHSHMKIAGAVHDEDVVPRGKIWVPRAVLLELHHLPLALSRPTIAAAEVALGAGLAIVFANALAAALEAEHPLGLVPPECRSVDIVVQSGGGVAGE